MDVRKRVLLDLFAAPSTLLPIVGGLSTLVLSWAIDGGARLNFVGLAGILAGVGIFATRLILGLEKIAEKAYEYLHTQQLEEQQKALDELDEKLKRDRDPRTQESLRHLRHLYDALVADLRDGKIKRNTHEILKIVEELFRASVAQLERSYRLWRAARRLSGDSKEQKLREREEVIREVVEATEHLDKTIQQFRALSAKRGRKELSRLREELDEAIRVARRTEERLAEWDPATHSQTEHE